MRSLLGGFLWIGILFVIDLIDSSWQLARSARRVQTDETAVAAAKTSIAQYLAGVGAAHLALALVAAAVLHLVLGLWFPSAPTRRRWWTAALAVAAAGTVVFYSHDMVMFPRRHTWFPWIAWYADHTHPTAILAFWGAVAAVALAVAARRWRGLSMKLLASRLAGLCLVLVVWAGISREPASAPAERNVGPNIVFIGIDALRPDHLAGFGYPRNTAPNIERFLQESATFDSAWTVFARTYPSWTSILSGQLPNRHGIRDNLPPPDELVPTDTRLLPQVLSDLGWHTTFVTDDSRFSYMVPGTGFQDIHQPKVGIQNFAISAHEPYFRLLGGLLYNRIGFTTVPVIAHNQAHGRTFEPLAFIDHAASLLRDSTRHDHFLYTIHTCVLHAPGDRPWPWHQMYGQRGYDGPNRFKYNRAGTTLAPTDDEEGLQPEDVAAQDERIYDAGVDMADRLVGRIMSELDGAGLLGNTIVVLLSDHGEETWEPDLPYKYFGPNHGYHPFGDGQHRTVLAIRFPDGRGAGTRVSDPVRTVDIVPTLVESMGLPWDGPFDGWSMGNLVDGGHDIEPRPVVIETGMSEGRYWNKGHATYPWKGVSERYRVEPESGWVQIREEFDPYLMAAKDRVYQQGDWKLVWRPSQVGRAEVLLFDRAADPVNRNDVAADHPLEVARLGLALADVLAEDGIAEPRVLDWSALLGRPPTARVQALAMAAMAPTDGVADQQGGGSAEPAQPEIRTDALRAPGLGALGLPRLDLPNLGPRSN